MKRFERKPYFRRLILMVLLLSGLYLAVMQLPNLPARTGKVDFRAYWSASHLLAHGRDFSDAETLLDVQKAHTDWDADYAMKTWNPPWVLVWLLPYGILDFERAATLWMLTNIAFLFTAVTLAWRLYATEAKQQKSLWLPVLLAVLFPSSLVALIFGQVNTLVLFGLTMFFYFRQTEKHWAAGVTLAFTMVKPHIVYLALAVSLLQLVRERNWRVLASFSLSLLVPILLTFVLRPTFVNEYLASVTDGQLLRWETPTLATYLALQSGWTWIRLIGLVLVPALLVVWWIFGNRACLLETVEATLFLSLLTAPFAWSYDFVVLLLPLTHLVYWLRYGFVPRLEPLLTVAALVVIYVLYYYQRVTTPSELYFFWVPVALAILYFWTRYRCRSVSARGEIERIPGTSPQQIRRVPGG